MGMLITIRIQHIGLHIYGNKLLVQKLYMLIISWVMEGIYVYAFCSRPNNYYNYSNGDITVVVLNVQNKTESIQLNILIIVLLVRNLMSL